MARGLAALSIPPRVGTTAAPTTGRPIRVTARPVGRGRRLRSMVVVRAGGPPSTNALILAFVLPLSLFVGTLITAARVADDLDERFLREMEIDEENEASDEESNSEDDDGEYDEEEVVRAAGGERASSCCFCCCCSAYQEQAKKGSVVGS